MDTLWTLKLTSELLGYLDNPRTVLAEKHMQAALRMDLQRQQAGLPSVCICLDDWT